MHTKERKKETNWERRRRWEDLKWISVKQGVRVWTGLNWLSIGQTVGFCECGDEP